MANECLIPSAPQPLWSGENPLNAGAGLHATETWEDWDKFFDSIKNLNITKRKKYPAKFNLAYGGCVACGVDACPSLTCDQAIFFEHVTPIVTLTHLFVLRSSPQFLRKREAASSLDIHYVPSRRSADQQSYRKSSCKKKNVF